MLTANLFFPTWILHLIPNLAWIFFIPANFAMDSLVLWLWCRRQSGVSFSALWKQSIVKVFILGFLSDFLAAFALLLLSSGLNYCLPQVNVYIGLGSFLFGLLGALIAMGLIYVLDARLAFEKTTLTADQKKSAASWTAVITAPWLMMIPTELLYMIL